VITHYQRGTGPVTARIDPDVESSSGASVQLPSARQLEAIHMRNKTPMNPNGGPSTPDIDLSSLSPRVSGGWDPTIDPTIALIDEENGTAEGGGYHGPSGGGYSDPVRPEIAPELPGVEGSTPPRREPYPYTS
jgi:hypothetical protein